MSGLLSLAAARGIVAAAISGPLEAEEVPVEAAAGRVLAEDVVATGDVPPFDNSAMDGFAVRAGAGPRTVQIVDEARAGRPAAHELRDGEAIRISTGAPVPSGADAVVPVERTTEGPDGTVVLERDVEPGANVRRAGEDVRAGAPVLARGTQLGPGELGAAVVAGRASLRCTRLPAVAVVVTGDELIAPGEPLAKGQIHESNGVVLRALAARAGAQIVGPRGDDAHWRVGDDRAATRAALDDALAAADVVVVSGGVSVGPHDHVKPALEALGVEERFWRVALKPGKPVWFGVRGETLVFGLPGNPVSAAVCFALFARPALRTLLGATDEPLRHARLAEDLARSPDRLEAVRVGLHTDADGTLTATPTGPRGSHITSSLVGADALALVPPGPDVLPAGELVELAAM